MTKHASVDQVTPPDTLLEYETAYLNLLYASSDFVQDQMVDLSLPDHGNAHTQGGQTPDLGFACVIRKPSKSRCLSEDGNPYR